MTNRIDLHLHTNESDGTDDPKVVAEKAHDLGLKAIAITDHDTTSGIIESPYADMEIVPGIEFSTKFKTKTHILGYFIDPECPELKSKLEEIVKDRDERNEKICALMRKDGISVTYDEMKEKFGKVVGRPHFAEMLIDKGLAKDNDNAFALYLDRGLKYWVKRKTESLETCISLITKAGGVAVLAHPFEYTYEENSLSELIEECMKYGLKGIECRHSSHDPGHMAYLESLADDYGLYKTGGSDYHGEHKKDISIGSGKGLVSVPYSWLEKLKEGRR